MTSYDKLDKRYLYVIRYKIDHWDAKVAEFKEKGNKRPLKAANGKGGTPMEAIEEAFRILPTITRSSMKIRKKKPGRGYERLGVLSLDEVLPLIPEKEPLRTKQVYATFFGVKVRLSSSRVITYKIHGVQCVGCPLKGEYFAVERQCRRGPGQSWHLNLYALSEGGHEVMMTRDHIIPKALKGSTSVENSQPMCSTCNARKGSKLLAFKERDLHQVECLRIKKAI